MNLAGIWIDLKVAILVMVTDEDDRIMKKVESNISVGNVKGGSGSSTPYGAQDAVSESKMLEKKKHELKEYYGRVENAIGSADQIMIAGPGQTRFELENHLKDSYQYKDTPIWNQREDNMTDNQVRALFREHRKLIVEG